MKKIRYGFVVMSMLLCSAFSAEARVSIGIGLPHVSIGINLPIFPELIPVPGYPVYYAPQVSANYFFYDGMYWVYQNDNWYSSYWYNGPWIFVEPTVVPLFILRVPVRYYRLPPVYFSGWHHNAPPRWGQHWGRGWEQKRSGWDKWNRNKVPARAPRPSYQREYSGDRYPKVEQQQELLKRSYRYQPRDKAVRTQWQRYPVKNEPASVRPAKQQESPAKPLRQQDPGAGRDGRDGRDVKPVQRTAPPESRSQTPQPQPPKREPAVMDRKQQSGPAKQEHQDPRLQDLEEKHPGKGEQRQQNRGGGKGQERDDDRDRGRGRDK